MNAPLDHGAVWAVVVNWNGGDWNLRCLAAAQAAGVKSANIVVVDNGSTDGSAERIAAEFPAAALLRMGENLGFGEAANRGATHALAAGAEALLLLNNDLELGRAALDLLIAELNAHPRTGACGPRLLLPGEPVRIWAAGGRLDHAQNISTLLGFGRPDGPPWNERQTVDYVVGAALCVRSQAWRQMDGLRADYFAYMEDVELGLRLRKAGWECVSVGAASAVHHPSSSTGGGYSPRRKYMQAVNSVRFLREYGDTRAWLRFWWFDVASLAPALAAGLVSGQAKGVMAKAAGLWHGMNGGRVEAERLEPGRGPFW